MECQTCRCNKASIPSGIFVVTPSIEGWPTKANEAPSPDEVRPTLLVTNPVLQSLGGVY